MIPRLVYACGRRHANTATLDNVSRELLELSAAKGAEYDWAEVQSGRSLATGVSRTVRELKNLVNSGDGWVVLCDFLFFASSYLRDILSDDANPINAVQTEEVISALALAANYRFTHAHVQPRASRLGLSELLRTLVTESAPGLVPPRNVAGAVKVMTCHASKGLEFPCVALAGQSLSQVSRDDSCLPPSLRPSSDDDAAQADSLLFVGVSRAESGVVISYATSASGTPRSRPRRFPKLLTAFQQSGIVPTETWDEPARPSEQVIMGRIWGGQTPSYVSTYSLSDSACQLRSYLEDQLGLRFIRRLRPLYPEFMNRVRRMLRRVFEVALLTGRSVSQSDALRIAEEEWPAECYQAHPHIELYRPRAQRWTQAFAQAFMPNGSHDTAAGEGVIEWKDVSGTPYSIRLQLIGDFLDSNGDRVVVALQLQAPDDRRESINWSALKDYERLPFVLLHESFGRIRPMVFCGEAGEIRSFLWSARKPVETIQKEAAVAHSNFQSLTLGKFDTRITDWACDHCDCRIICPWWVTGTGNDQRND